MTPTTAERSPPPTPVAQLAATETYRKCSRLVREAAGLTPELAALEEWPPARRRTCANPFCMPLLQAGVACEACASAEAALTAGCPAPKPLTVSCVAALREIGAPICAGKTPVAFVHLGPLLAVKPSRKQFAVAAQVLASHGVSCDSAALQAAYFRVPVVPAERFTTVLHLLELCARELSTEATRILRAVPERESEPIARARRFIEENSARPLTLPEVAQAAGLSATYLCRTFKKATGYSVVEYLTRLRVAKAQALLRDPGLRVKEVAYASGFQSVAHFNRAFKKLTGVSPQEFRRLEFGPPDPDAAAAADGATTA